MHNSDDSLKMWCCACAYLHILLYLHACVLCAMWSKEGAKDCNRLNSGFGVFVKAATSHLPTGGVTMCCVSVCSCRHSDAKWRRLCCPSALWLTPSPRWRLCLSLSLIKDSQSESHHKMNCSDLIEFLADKLPCGICEKNRAKQSFVDSTENGDFIFLGQSKETNKHATVARNSYFIFRVKWK